MYSVAIWTVHWMEITGIRKLAQAEDVGNCVGGRSFGIVKHFDASRDKGIITADDGSGDLPFQSRDILECPKTLAKGDKVEYDPLMGSKEYFATYSTKIGRRILLCRTCGKVGHQCRTNTVCYKFYLLQ